MAFFETASNPDWTYDDKRLIVDGQHCARLLADRSVALSPQLAYEFDANAADEVTAFIAPWTTIRPIIAYRSLPPVNHRTLDDAQFVFYRDMAELQQISTQNSALLPHTLRHIIDHVETPEQFEAVQKNKFRMLDGYRGRFFMSIPVKHRRRTLNPNMKTLSTIVRLASEELDFSDVEDILKQDIALTYKLLRYVSSPAFGMRRPVVHIRDALQILGLNNLFRWLSLQMLSSASGPGSLAMIEMSLIRAQFMDLLSKRFLHNEKSDTLYLIGAFSALNHIMGISFDEIFKEIPFSADITSALHADEGIYGPLLKLAKTLEQSEPAMAEALAGSIGVPIDVVNAAHFDSLFWFARARESVAASSPP